MCNDYVAASCDARPSIKGPTNNKRRHVVSPPPDRPLAHCLRCTNSESYSRLSKTSLFPFFQLLKGSKMFFLHSPCTGLPHSNERLKFIYVIISFLPHASMEKFNFCNPLFHAWNHSNSCNKDLFTIII